MKKWIRWPGLIVFVGVVLILIGFWWLLVDNMIERWIEKGGTRLVGAKVELGKADLKLGPLGLALEDLQITNPKQPMTNILEAGSIDLAIEASHLLRRKLIVSLMTADNLRFNTSRKTSGAIARKKPSSETSDQTGDAKSDAFKMPSLAVPDVKEILSREELQTVTAADELKKDISAFKEKWQKRLDELPDQDTFEQYEKRIDKVGSAKKSITGVLGATGKAKAIYDDVNRDLEELKQAKKDLKKELASLKKKAAQVKGLPAEDYRRLRDKYSLSSQGAVNITQMLFGDKAGQYLKLFLDGYHTLKPLLEMRPATPDSQQEAKPVRGKGVDVHFALGNQPPPFLVRLAKVSATIPYGDISGEIQNLTPFQAHLGKPLVFTFSGQNLKGLQEANIDGVLNHIDPPKASDRVTAVVEGLKVGEKSNQRPVYLEKGLADLELAAAVVSGRIDAQLQAAVSSASIATAKNAGDGQLGQTLQEALAGISAFDLQADIKGDMDDYHVSLSSNIDDVLKDAMGKQFKKKAGAFEKSLNDAIAAKTREPLAENSGMLSDLNSIENELSARLGLGDAVRKDALKKVGLK
ncbi:MAG: TIGR03545 family protein [Thermodesulfobacteriota bacterium]